MRELPTGWAETTLAQLVSPDRPRELPQDLPHLPFVGMEHVEAHSMRLLGTVPASGLKSSAVNFQAGDVLYGRLRPYLNKVLLARFEGLCSAEFIVFGRRAEVSSEWLAYFLNSSPFVSFSSHLNAGDRPRVDFDQIGTYGLLVAPRAEQDRIVAEIDKQFTRLDAATAALKRVQANLKRYRASVLKAACEGRLVPTEAELARKEGRDYEPAEKLLQRILRERRARWEADTLAKMQASGKPPKDDHWKQKYKEPSAPDSSNLPKLPEGWCWASLDQLIVSGPQNGLYKAKTSYGKGTPIVRIDDYQNDWHRPATDLRVLQLDAEELSLYRLEPCDILINRVNSPSHLGKCISVPDGWAGTVFESNMMRLQVAELLSIQYLMDYLHSNEGRTKLTSNAKWAVNQASINQEDVKDTAVPLPPRAEQARIAESVSLAISGQSRTSEAVAVQMIHSSRLRQAILSSAFTGQLVPQDPTDEPASTLLARIRAERAATDRGKTLRSPKKRLKP